MQRVDGVMIYDLGVTDVFVPDAKRELIRVIFFEEKVEQEHTQLDVRSD